MKKIVILLITLCLCGCSNSISKTGVITYEDALNLIEKDAILVDVRTESEYNEEHIDNAILMPLDTINESTSNNIIDSKNKIVIVYCKSGNRSKQAQEILNQLGYANVYNLGSIYNWQG